MKRVIIIFAFLTTAISSLRLYSQDLSSIDKANCYRQTILTDAKRYYDAGKYDKSIGTMQNFIESSTDSILNSKVYLWISYIQRRQKDYIESRQSTYKALEQWSDWGYPYLQQGKLCLTTYWSDCASDLLDKYALLSLAISKFEIASTIDSSLRSEAKRWIFVYEKYLPTENDLLQINYHEGQTVVTKCWPEEPIRVRTKNEHPPTAPMRHAGERWR